MNVGFLGYSLYTCACVCVCVHVLKIAFLQVRFVRSRMAKISARILLNKKIQEAVNYPHRFGEYTR